MDKKLTFLAGAGLVLATVMGALSSCADRSATPPALTTSPTAVVSASTPSVAPAVLPAQRSRFLADLDAHHVPRSASGQSEVLIGQGVCDQLAAGRDIGTIAHELATSLGSWSFDQASVVVAAARGELCNA